MRFFACLCALLLQALAAPVAAQVLSESWVVEEWDEASGRWVEVPGSERFVAHTPAASPSAAEVPSLPGAARFGPFAIAPGGSRAVLNGLTDSASPAHFAALLRAFPGVTTLELRDCPGTADDSANLRLGRMIRAAGIATHVPRGGSVRSGAVELFLAGATRRIDDGAEFAVHAWLDSSGHEASEYAADHPVHNLYLAYYREMGMSAAEAQRFYAMTNAAPFDNARWLGASEMRRWVAADAGAPAAANDNPHIAYLDLAAALP